KDIQPHWPGVFTEDIDGVIFTPAGVPDNQPGPKIYFFKGAQYIRLDVASVQADGGYPKDIASEWHGLW
ncbi:MAG: hypothetical protein HY269_00285, partial [Deltaproteobacteria bacterium]|nr:hypothetical protein [Deltaproteobacteria bacterium]